MSSRAAREEERMRHDALVGWRGLVLGRPGLEGVGREGGGARSPEVGAEPAWGRFTSSTSVLGSPSNRPLVQGSGESLECSPLWMRVLVRSNSGSTKACVHPFLC